MSNLEKGVEKLTEEKTEILKWCEENPQEFSAEKTTRLAEIEKKITEKEAEWMELELELDVLNQSMN